MTQNKPVTPLPISEQREKLAWFRQRTDGLYDVVMYYPKTDKFKWYVADWCLSLAGDGETIEAEDMTERLLAGVKLREWSVGKLLYFWRAK